MSLSFGKGLILILQPWSQRNDNVLLIETDIGWVVGSISRSRTLGCSCREETVLLLDAGRPAHNFLCPIAVNLNVMCL